jgi:hypothetical protein
MRRSFFVATLVLACGCNAELMDPPGAVVDAPPGSGDAGVDGPGADAFMLGAWGPPAKVTGASSGAAEDDGTLANGGLELVFAVADPADGNNKDLYIMTRSTTTSAFGLPAKLPFSVTGSSDETPRFSPNGLTLYFASNRGAVGNLDIYRVTRQAVGGAWSQPALVPGVNTTALEKWFMPCGTSNDYLVIQGGDIAKGTVGGGPPTVVTELSAPNANETGTFLTGDCLTVYFASVRSGTNKMYTSHRTSLTTAWQAPATVDDFVMIGGDQEDPWLADDGRTFVFVSNVSGTKDVYISVR